MYVIVFSRFYRHRSIRKAATTTTNWISFWTRTLLISVTDSSCLLNLGATVDIAIWSTIEMGLAISAASFSTLRPLARSLGWNIGFTYQDSAPSGENSDGRWRGNVFSPGRQRSRSRQEEEEETVPHNDSRDTLNLFEARMWRVDSKSTSQKSDRASRSAQGGMGAGPDSETASFDHVTLSTLGGGGRSASTGDGKAPRPPPPRDFTSWISKSTKK